MSLWLVQHDRIRVGNKVTDLGINPYYVAETINQVPISTYMRNYNAKNWNLLYKNEPQISLESEVKKWHMRLKRV